MFKLNIIIFLSALSAFFLFSQYNKEIIKDNEIRLFVIEELDRSNKSKIYIKDENSNARLNINELNLYFKPQPGDLITIYYDKKTANKLTYNTFITKIKINNDHYYKVNQNSGPFKSFLYRKFLYDKVNLHLEQTQN